MRLVIYIHPYATGNGFQEYDAVYISDVLDVSTEERKKVTLEFNIVALEYLDKELTTLSKFSRTTLESVN